MLLSNAAPAAHREAQMLPPLEYVAPAAQALAEFERFGSAEPHHPGRRVLSSMAQGFTFGHGIC